MPNFHLATNRFLNISLRALKRGFILLTLGIALLPAPPGWAQKPNQNYKHTYPKSNSLTNETDIWSKLTYPYQASVGQPTLYTWRRDYKHPHTPYRYIRVVYHPNPPVSRSENGFFSPRNYKQPYNRKIQRAVKPGSPR